MRLILITAIFSIFLIDCSPGDKKIPENILPVDSMKIIVWHMEEAGAYATILKQKDSTIKKLNTAYFSQVLKLHHLTKTQFINSFNFYKSHPYFAGILFDSVSDYASRQRGEIYKLGQ